MTKPTYHVILHDIEMRGDFVRLKVELTADDPLRPHFTKGDVLGTSAIQSIDFRSGVAVTRNTVYVFEPHYPER